MILLFGCLWHWHSEPATPVLLIAQVKKERQPETRDVIAKIKKKANPDKYGIECSEGKGHVLGRRDKSDDSIERSGSGWWAQQGEGNRRGRTGG